jgi:hypothetical protein
MFPTSWAFGKDDNEEFQKYVQYKEHIQRQVANMIAKRKSVTRNKNNKETEETEETEDSNTKEAKRKKNNDETEDNNTKEPRTNQKDTNTNSPPSKGDIADEAHTFGSGAASKVRSPELVKNLKRQFGSDLDEDSGYRRSGAASKRSAGRLRSPAS